MIPLLSLVIPVYAVEKYIEACLKSVFSQLPDWAEVILVNDGSPDNSMTIVRERFDHWITSGRLILLEQDNRGLGAARNAGIKQSRGEFIGFLDSDDIILEHYFSTVGSYLKNREIDIVEFGFKCFKNDTDISNELHRPLYGFEGMKTLDDVREEVFAVGCWYTWTRIYRTELIKRYLFPENKHYEDLMTIPFLYLLDLTVFFIGKPLVAYRDNPQSITSNRTKKQLEDLLGFYKSISLESDCDAMKFLKIKTARSMVFFYSELHAPAFPINELVSEIRTMRLSPIGYKKLLLPDRLFFNFPALYVFVDKIRVPVKRLIAKLK